VPQYWKIEGMPDRAAFDRVESAIREQHGPLQLILGKGAGMDLVRRWFAAAGGGSTAAGFAIGRTVYFEAAALWLQGQLDRSAAIARIRANYEGIIAVWTETVGERVTSG
jgi:5-dehydro-2-deoxygluconokinase